jgi:hypothetical protein
MKLIFWKGDGRKTFTNKKIKYMTFQIFDKYNVATQREKGVEVCVGGNMNVCVKKEVFPFKCDGQQWGGN